MQSRSMQLLLENTNWFAAGFKVADAAKGQ
jgi:hypothetical protein